MIAAFASRTLAFKKACVFFKYVEENIFILKTRKGVCCVGSFYNAGVVTRDRRIGS
jgi:hypothetical protein